MRLGSFSKLAGCCVLLALTACKKDAPFAPAAPAERYSSTAVVKRVSAEQRLIMLDHAAIPEFKGQDGRVVGMPAMTMPFEVAANVPLEGVRPGMKVRFTFEMRWDAQLPNHLVALAAAPTAGPEDGGLR